MPYGDADDLLAFTRVRVLKATAGALRCLIGDRRVWLPRHHIKGALACRGDSGTLFVRRWIALDRRLTLPGPLRLLSQPVPAVVQRCHWYEKPVAASLHDPAVVVSVWCTCAVPVTAGAAVLPGVGSQ